MTMEIPLPIHMNGRSIGIQQTTMQVSDTSDIFLATGLSPDTWTCTVTPHDGTNDGASSR